MLAIGLALTISWLTTEDGESGDELVVEDDDAGDPDPPDDEPPPDEPDGKAEDGLTDDDEGGELVDHEPLEEVLGVDAVVYALGADAVARVDLATGAHRERRLPEGSGLGGPVHVAVTGDQLVVARSGGTMLVLPSDLDGEVRELEEPRTDQGVVQRLQPGPGDGEVTLVRSGVQEVRIDRVDVLDGSVPASVALPGPAQVLHVEGSQAIVGLAGEVFRHDLDTGDGERIAAGSPIAADGERVFYTRCGAELECAVMSQGLDGDDAAMLLDDYVPPPWGEPLSPDGRWLRVERYLGHDPETLIVELESGATHSHPQRMRATGSGPPTYTWTPGGEWLLEPAGSSVRARPPEGGETIELQLDVGGIEALTVVS